MTITAGSFCDTAHKVSLTFIPNLKQKQHTFHQNAPVTVTTATHQTIKKKPNKHKCANIQYVTQPTEGFLISSVVLLKCVFPERLLTGQRKLGHLFLYDLILFFEILKIRLTRPEQSFLCLT